MESNNANNNNSNSFNNMNNLNPPPNFSPFIGMNPMNNNYASIPSSFLFNPNNLMNKTNSDSFLLKSLEKLKSGDDMDIMSELISLCEYLSLSDGVLGTNPNLGKLLEEICKNLDKTYLPELVIYSLQCMNYILDLNPRLASILRKNNIIVKLTNLINTIDDVTCLDSIVTAFEKISLNNAILLLENNVFYTLLNIIDFLGKSQRESVIKCCLNISYNVLNYKQYDVYIKPASNILSNLIQYREGITDANILEKIIDIYFNIVNNLKANMKEEMAYSNQLESELIKYNYFENFYDILTRYFIERDKKLNPELIKKILINIQIVCGLSTLAVDKYLSINLLNILVEVINFEFSNNQINNNNSIDNTNSTFLTELFSVLISLFPSLKEEDSQMQKDIKILSKKNQKFYKFFCKEILKPLVNNIMSKSACGNLDNLIQLILVFIQTTDKDNIIANVDPKPISQIISKLLDTKYYVYLNDLGTLINILMEKTSNYYMNNFIREGIIENIKNYISELNPEKIDFNDNESDENKDNPTGEKDLIKELFTKFKKGEANRIELLDNLLMLDEQTLNKKREEFISEQKILTQKKIRQLYDKYFTQEKIDEFNKNVQNSSNDVKQSLSSLDKDLSKLCKNTGTDNNNNNKIIQIIKKIIELLTNPKNEITFFELESSKILISLCKFFEPSFMSLYDKLDFQKDNSPKSFSV